MPKNKIKTKERLFYANKRAILSLDKQNGNDFKEINDENDSRPKIYDASGCCGERVEVLRNKQSKRGTLLQSVNKFFGLDTKEDCVWFYGFMELL